MPIHTVLTYDDYAALPATGQHYELHDGELAVTPAPSPRHQRISGRLFRLLEEHVRTSAHGEVLYAPVDCILAVTTVVQPDLVYLAPDRQGAVTARGIEGPPTLVVEILSPATSLLDRGAKSQLYARHGVPYYWIVDPDAETIEAFRLQERTYEAAGSLRGGVPAGLVPFPDLILPPRAIWP